MNLKIFPFIIAWLTPFVMFQGPNDFAEAFEGYTGNQKKLTCQTACHQPENILQANRDKMKVSPCKDCHLGAKGPLAKSPFLPRKRFLLTSADGKPAKPHPFIQPGNPIRVTAKVNPESSNPPTHPETPARMAYIPAGEFIMGSNERWDDEAPEHISRTDGFFMDLHEITNADYKKFVAGSSRKPPYHWPEGEIPKGKENHPVVYVNWFDANDYCQWTGKRLPTELEWEKAARGEDGIIYPWGNFWDLNKSNNPYKYSTGTEPVGSYDNGRSPYGLYDMSGNVWEWVDSFYLPHPGNPVTRGEYGEDKRVLKGGSWFDCLSYGCGLSAPTFNRSFFTPEVRNNSFGFRCAQSLSGAKTAQSE